MAMAKGQCTAAVQESLSLVRALLVSGPGDRLTARDCLAHPWLADTDIYIDILHELETRWMRRCLARRRWHRALNALKAMHTMVQNTFPDIVPGINRPSYQQFIKVNLQTLRRSPS